MLGLKLKCGCSLNYTKYFGSLLKMEHCWVLLTWKQGGRSGTFFQGVYYFGTMVRLRCRMWKFMGFLHCNNISALFSERVKFNFPPSAAAFANMI